MNTIASGNSKQKVLSLLSIFIVTLVLCLADTVPSEAIHLNDSQVEQSTESNYWQMQFDAYQHQPGGIIETKENELWLYGKLVNSIFSMKIDAFGNQKSFATFDLPGYQPGSSGNAVATGTIVEDGYVLGMTMTLISSTSQPNKGWLIKIDDSGTVVESLLLEDEEIFEISALTTSEDGSVIIGGRKGYSVWIAKATKDLEIVWEKTYISPSYNGPTGPNYGFALKDITETDDGGIVALSSFTNLAIDVDSSAAWIIKTNEFGELDGTNSTWEKLFGYINQANMRLTVSSLTPSHDGGIIIGGANSEFVPGSYQSWLAKFSTDGSLDWQNVYGPIPTSLLSGSSIRDISSVGGGYLVTGPGNSYRAFLNMIGEQGEVVWSRYASYYYLGGQYVTTMTDGSIGFVVKHTTVTGSETYLKIMKLNPTIDRPACIDFKEDDFPEIRSTNAIEISRQQNIQGEESITSGQSIQNFTSQSMPLVLELACIEEDLKVLGPMGGATLLDGETLTFYTNLLEIQNQLGGDINQVQLEAFYGEQWQAIGTPSTDMPYELVLTVNRAWIDESTNSLKLRLRVYLANGVIIYMNPSNTIEYNVSPEAGVNLNVRYADQVFIQKQMDNGYWNLCGPSSAGMMLHYLNRIQDDILYNPEPTQTLAQSILVNKISNNESITNALTDNGIPAVYKTSGITFDLIRTSIDNGYPVILSIQDQPDPNHIVLITGYLGDDTIIVNDPYGAYNWWGRKVECSYPLCRNIPSLLPPLTPMFEGYHIPYSFSENGDKDISASYTVFAKDALPAPDSKTQILENGVTTIRTENVEAFIQTGFISQQVGNRTAGDEFFTLAEQHAPSVDYPDKSSYLVPFSITSSVPDEMLTDLKIDLVVDVDASLLENWKAADGLSDPNILIKSTNRMYFARLDSETRQWVELTSTLIEAQNELRASVFQTGEYAVFIESTSTVIIYPDQINEIFLPLILFD